MARFPNSLVRGAAALAALLALGGASTPAPPVPVTIELFTSQGCSSCPPADRLMEDLARDPGLVVLTRPVTYWDRLGWRDTLARPANTALQQAYAQHIEGERGVYTPQAVVNGRFGTVGARARQIAGWVASERARPMPALVVLPGRGGGAGIGIAGPAERHADVVLVALASAVRVRIGSGENAGRAVIYTNVVKAERIVDGWSGGKLSVVLPPERLAVSGADRYAVLLREPGGGPVLAARFVPASP